MTEDEIRRLFREMKEEPVPADSLARVRLGIAKGREKSRMWMWLVPVLVATAILAAIFFRPRAAVPGPAQPRLIAARSLPPAPVMAAPEVRRIVHHPHRRVESRNGTLMRIETNDPSVVILLVGE